MPQLEMAFRWYGPDDPVTLNHIAQIPSVTSVVTALYDVAPGELWPKEKVETLKAQIQDVGLRFDVVESVPVHDDIKLGRPPRDQLIDNYADTITLLGELDISLVVYNFMPLFDWFRTELEMELEDGSRTMAYDDTLVDPNTDPWAQDWPAYFQIDESVADLKAAYRGLDETGLRDNLAYFLERVVPVAEQAGVCLGLHPDDPPWSILGIPRIVKNIDDLRWILQAVDNRANGLTLCVGSLGAEVNNDPSAMVREFGDRIHFVHGRNVKHTGERQFHECAHPPQFGDVNLVEILQALHEVDYKGPIRPDHGRMIWGETGTPGYGLYDRALGATYLSGVWDGIGSAHEVDPPRTENLK